MTEKTELAEQFAAGKLLLIDKPLHWTSFDAVSKVKSLLKHKLGLKKIKVGHAGTLDPLASGLLIICTGKMTRQIDVYQAQEKEYTGTFFIGATTPSSDLETKPDQTYPTEHISRNLLDETIKENFTGTLQQVPSLFSAKKIDGKRAYEHARAGNQIELKANEIIIHDYEITRFELPEADFRVVCSKGTYIRSLARDLGQQLQSGAYLKTLRRTRIGDISVEQAISIEDFEKQILEAIAD
ncbi:MAG: tRNA pseudouridine(55) synthase TruB [Bacteroidetes bacterium]|nr:MAG: tRNA pseudouridine(55) synthase TruB [Bacteroidota bacterium]